MTVFTVPKSLGSKRVNRFPFRVADGGKVFSVPFVQYLSGAGADYLEEAAEKGHDEIRLTRRLVEIESPDASEAVAKMSRDQVKALGEAWAEASTASVGESLASDNS
ncbi:hypothetical protein [Antrihabitans cavernicola]|uniref:Uncharacterized protein n=1 Tax=Antrihabitans cavernicola TaxID=2495913 RepID=A0A5A7SAE2_9NOCA|nr:hypothetical protein [Spelaeibacter cavernicola]KAA0021807.1 hypothetical protein FOY51_15495 [Spelaeibacter cavernicola]